jgi:hypothetical protein
LQKLGWAEELTDKQRILADDIIAKLESMLNQVLKDKEELKERKAKRRLGDREKKELVKSTK